MEHCIFGPFLVISYVPSLIAHFDPSYLLLTIQQASKILCVHTLFEGPVEDLAVDDGHTLIAATGLGRIVVLSISLYTLSKSLNVNQLQRIECVQPL